MGESNNATEDDLLKQDKATEILADIQAIIFECDLQEKRFTYVSPQAEHLLGYPNRLWFENPKFWEETLLHPDDRERAIAECMAKAGQGIPYELEYRLITASDQTMWVRGLLHPKLDDKGEVQTLRGVIFDITREKQFESDLKASELRFREIAEATSDVFWVTELNPERITYVSPAFEKVYGRKVEEVYADPQLWTKVIHPEDHDRVLACYANWGADPENYSFNNEYRIVRPDGEIRYLHDEGHAIQNHEGKVYRLSGIARDVTEVKKAERAAIEGQARSIQIAEATSDVFWVTELTPEERIVYVTPSFEAVWGQPTQAIYDDPRVWLEPIHPDDREKVSQQYSAWVKDPVNESYNMEYRIIDPQGNVRWMMPRGFPYFDSQGEIVMLTGIVRDITEIKEAEERKDQFIATLAHELRNPLLPLKVGLNVLRESPEDQSAVSKCIDDMDQQLEQLTHVVEDLLNLSRISRGVVQLNLEWTSLRSMIDVAANTAEPLIREKRHELTVDCPDGLEIEVDSTRMAQAVANLLLNAAKYTPKGGRIECRVNLEDDELCITIKDNGIGIPQEMREGIFEMFQQVETKQAGEAGLGIGLTLVKSIIELHGGQISIEDTDSPGTTFVVRAPTPSRAAPSAAPKATPNPMPKQSKILVVDDSQSNARLISIALKPSASDVQTASDGYEALEKAEAMRPDVIVMDIGMPRMDGYEAAKEIRQKPWGADIRLIALTGWGQEKDVQKVKEAGFDFHVVKPPDIDLLRKLVSFEEDE